MDNASKALIIAGGVLISVMVASLLVYLFTTYGNHAKQVYDAIHERQQTEANNEYTKYEGSDKLTIYDVVTVTNKAKDNNNSLNLTNAGQRGYINVKLNGISGIPNPRELEKLDDVVKLLENNECKDKFYKCNIKSKDGLINQVEFSVVH